MQRFEKLLPFLEECLASPDPAQVHRLQSKLEKSRPHFLRLLDVPPKSAKEKDELEKGSFSWEGHQHRANKDFIDESLVLSNALDASEFFSASLLRQGIVDAARLGRSSTENGLLVFYSERAALLRCLQAIWRGALSADERVIRSGLQDVLYAETQELLHGKADARAVVAAGKAAPSTSFLSRVFDVFDSSAEQALKLRQSLATALPAAGTSSLLGGAKQAAKPAFSDEVTEERIRFLQEERHLVGQLLYLLALARQLTKVEIGRSLTWLSSASPSDPVSVYVLAILLAALDTSDEEIGESMGPLFTDIDFIKDTSKQLSTGSWRTPQLQSVVLLQWTLFLVSASKHVSNFESETGLYEENVDKLVWQALEGGVWPYLGREVLKFKWDDETEAMWGGVGLESIPTADEVVSQRLDPLFQDWVVDQVELLVVAFIHNMGSVLRKLKTKEEDSVFSISEEAHYRSLRRADQPRKEPRHDLEAFFLLIATMYRNSPDSGLKFWADSAQGSDTSSFANLVQLPGSIRLASFLRWGSEVRAPGMMRAFYEMISSLATGPECATFAFKFLSAGDGGNGQASAAVSWANLFGCLDHYNTSTMGRPDGQGMPGEISPEEVVLLKSFVRLLKEVVTYSDVARATLYDSQRHRPVVTLFNLLARPIPIDLKAVLLDALAAFSRPGQGQFGVEVARKIWLALEQSQILPTIAHPGQPTRTLRGRQALLQGGIVTELEEVETVNGHFPESTAFVKLLTALIHLPSDPTSLRNGVELEGHTIPESLGAPYRSPGIEPYVRFVIDEVHLKAGTREYQDPRERWRVTEACLAFVETCLTSFDIAPFLAAVAVGGQRASTAANSPLSLLLAHPGFDILLRLLSGGSLMKEIVTIVIAGEDALTKNLAGTHHFAGSLLRSLRIIYRVFELQKAFLEVLLPTIEESKIHLSADKVDLLKGVVTIDQHLLYASDSVVQICLLVSYSENLEIALFAVKILAKVADSPHFDVVDKYAKKSKTRTNRLIALIDASDESSNIKHAFVRRLGEDVPNSEMEMDEWVPGAATENATLQACRTSILDLLLQCTQPDRKGPNLAHLLLGFGTQERQTDMVVDGPGMFESEATCLPVILDLLGQNVPESEEDVGRVSLLSRQPTFTAKCYTLIRQLCVHEYTSAAISRYLRTQERFFFRQSRAIPFRPPASATGALGEVVYADGVVVETSSSAVCAVLQAEAALLDSMALELNVLSTANDKQPTTKLVATLFGDDHSATEAAAKRLEDVGALQSRMLEVFYSFDFSWQDAISMSETRLTYFGDLRYDTCLEQNANGCVVYNFEAVAGLLRAARRELQSRGVFNANTARDEVRAETTAIVENLVVENHRREIQFARVQVLRAWRNTVDITVAKCFGLLKAEQRRSILLDILGAILPPIAAPEADSAVAEVLSGAAVLYMTKLREESEALVGVDDAERSALSSPEQLLDILRTTLAAAVKPGMSPVVRGNLYAVFLNYLKYCDRISAAARENDDSLDDDRMSLAGSSLAGGAQASKRSPLSAGNLLVLQASLDRLLPIVCKDATFGPEVWRTVAFSALDALAAVGGDNKSSNKATTTIAKQGYLRGFVASLKQADLELQETLKPDPESLNALYVYEAQMSFLARFASTRDGASKVLDAGLLAQLGQCDFLGARPVEDDPNSMDYDGFLPAATERHHQLLLPALQAAVACLVGLGPENTLAVQQALSFANGQRDTLSQTLLDCAAAPSSPLLQEAQLIVTLLSFVYPAVSEDDLVSLSSFGALHAAILTLSAKVCGTQSWITKVMPYNDAEREETESDSVDVRTPMTLFSERIHTLAAGTQIAVLSYFAIATKPKTASSFFKPIWLPSMSYTGTTTIPSLGTATAFLLDLSQTTKRLVDDCASLAGKLARVDSTSAQELEETLVGLKSEKGLSTGDRKARAAKELELLTKSKKAKLETSLQLVEVSLLLYLRHLSFFFDTSRPDRDAYLSSARPDVGMGLAESLLRTTSSGRPNPLRALASAPGHFNPSQLRQGVLDAFQLVGERLGNLKLGQVGWTVPEARAREAWLGSVVRKVGETLKRDDEDM